MIWRPTPDRLKSFAQAREFWSSVGDLHLFDSGHTIFNRAASRNLAVAAAHKLGHYKLVITDSDCIPEWTPIRDAFNKVNNSAVHLPYTQCHVLNRAGNVTAEYSFTCGGTYVTTVDGWNSVGGQDELFDRWAPEDMAFKLAHETLLGPMTRHEGVLLSLAHDADTHRHSDSETDPLVQRYRRYESAAGDVDRMRELCFPY